MDGSPARLGALAPLGYLLGVYAEGLSEATPAEAAGLLEAFETLTEILRQDAALQGLRPIRTCRDSNLVKDLSLRCLPRSSDLPPTNSEALRRYCPTPRG